MTYVGDSLNWDSLTIPNMTYREQARWQESFWKALDAYQQEQTGLAMDMQMCQETVQHNQDVLKRNNIQESDGIPWYVSEEMLPAPAHSESEIRTFQKESRESFYDQVLSADSLLTLEMRRSLGDDYVKYQQELESEGQKVVSRQRTVPEGFCNVYQQDDDWSFDEM